MGRKKKVMPEAYSEDRKKAEEEKEKELKIKDLKAGMKKVNINLEITEIGEKREFNKFGRTGFVADGLVKDVDGTETIKITLWNTDIDILKVGDKIRFENSYIYEYQNELVITAGKYGRIVKL